jgi:PAS domain S-box-containing protein
MFGCDTEKLLGTPFVELVAPAHRQHARDLESRLDAGESTATIDLVFLRPNGDFVSVQTSVANHTIGGRRYAIFVAREQLKNLAQVPTRPTPS